MVSKDEAFAFVWCEVACLLGNGFALCGHFRCGVGGLEEFVCLFLLISLRKLLAYKDL